MEDLIYLAKVFQLSQGQQTSLVAQTVKRLPTMRVTWVRSLGQEDPLEKEIATHSSTIALQLQQILIECMQINIFEKN